MSVTEMLPPSQDSPTGFPDPDSALVTWRGCSGLVRENLSHLGQPPAQVEAALPVGQVVHQDDAVHRVEEHVPG